MARKATLGTSDADRLLKSLLLLSRTVDHVLETKAVAAATKTRLSTSKVQVLRLLGQRGSQTASQVARFLSVSKPAVTQIIDSMVRDKTVSRKTATQDRREVGLTLASKGKEQYQLIRNRQRHLIRAAARQTPGRDAGRWITTLWEISEGLVQADNTFTHYCLQCGAHEDATCVLSGGSADCHYLSQPARKRQSASTSAARGRSTKPKTQRRRAP